MLFNLARGCRKSIYKKLRKIFWEVASLPPGSLHLCQKRNTTANVNAKIHIRKTQKNILGGGCVLISPPSLLGLCISAGRKQDSTKHLSTISTQICPLCQLFDLQQIEFCAILRMLHTKRKWMKISTVLQASLMSLFEMFVGVPDRERCFAEQQT